jgi:D-aminopeptidase
MSDASISIGRLPVGPRGTIADVAGVTIGHATLATGDLQTGVTVIRPHARDPFLDKVPAAAVVINGFGKSAGLLQLNELGVFETPIALTTTLSVGAIAMAQVRAAIKAHPALARNTTTVNPLVFECNDGYLNDVQALAVGDAHYEAALAAATADFARGAAGAGRGMTCFGLKGGVGSASRIVDVNEQQWTLGVLVLANFGRLETFALAGRPLGSVLASRLAERQARDTSQRDQGSIIVVIATDAPLDHRQLRRVATRSAAGIGRTGGYYGHGSGDIALAFSTAATVPHYDRHLVRTTRVLTEAALEPFFEATAEATEHAIVDAMLTAETVRGFAGHVRYALTDVAPDWAALIR